MDSNITINIVEPGSTPVVPNTGLFTSGIGGPEATIIGIAAVVLLAAIVAAIIYYRKKKQGKVGSLLAQYKQTLKHKKVTTIGLTALALIVSVGTFATLLKLGVKAIDADTQADEVASEETNEVATAEDGEITIELGDTPVFAYIPTTVTVTEDMPAGYTLKAYSEHPTLSSDITDKIIDLVTIPEDEYENAGRLTTSLTDNTWGLSIEKPESEAQDIYFSLPATADEAVIIKSTEDFYMTEDNTITVYYGVYITPDMPCGTYTGASVSYEVEPNRTDLATVTFDSNGLFFDGGKTTNVVKYEKAVTDKTELYSHTPNVDDDGVQTPGEKYPLDLNMTFVYEFANATMINLNIVKTGNEGCCGPDQDDYFSFWSGNHPDYAALVNYDTAIKAFGNTNGKYVFGSYNDNNIDIDVSSSEEQNSITFAYTTDEFREDSSGGGSDGYGYYAIITATGADGNPAYAIGNVPYSGTYETPTTTAYTDYEFLGWSMDPNATFADFASADDISINLLLSEGEKVTLYAVWSPIVDISYDGNSATAGSMESTSYDGDTPTTVTLAHEDVIAANTINLYAPNYKKTGYGFAGWSTDQNAWEDLTDNNESNNPTIYGPNQTFTMTKDMALAAEDGDMTLYAVWVPAEQNNGTPVTLQNWTGCSSLTATTYNAETGTFNVGANTITALTDARDGNVYTIARLSDGNCWMVENLRLDNTATISTTNTNNPVTVDNNVAIKNNDGNTSNHLSPNSNSWCTSGSADCFNQSYLNTFNTNLGGEGAIASYNGGYDSEKAFQWYSYGNNYNWYSATAGNGTYSTGEQGAETVDGDICPAGWSLPIGNRTEANGSFSNLDTTMGGTGSWRNTSEQWRSFPNNFVYSGSWYGSSAYSRGNYGYYWSSAAGSTYSAYCLGFDSDDVNPGTGGDGKYYGYSARCVAPVGE